MTTRWIWSVPSQIWVISGVPRGHLGVFPDRARSLHIHRWLPLDAFGRSTER